MTLRLSVVSEHGIRLGTESSKIFGVHGGSIGRSTDNEWILPDPERYLSGKHARVDFRAGSYVLVDLSSNGTYVNGAQVPLGKYHDYVLKDGDYVRLGEYELLASIDEGNDFPPDRSAIVAYDGTAPSSAVGKSTAGDLGADLDLSMLLEPNDPPTVSYGVLPRDAYGQAAGTLRDPEPGGADAPATPWHMMTRPIDVVARTVPPGGRSQTPPLPYDGDADPGLAAFCRGAGVDPRTISPEARTNALLLAGQLLRESVLGLLDLNQSRREFRSRFRLPAPPEEVPESPLGFSGGVEEALSRLLTNVSRRSGSVDALRDHFKGLKAENAAALAAMHAAFEEFLGRVDPKQLEERFDRAGKRGVFGAPNKHRHWELYAEMFVGLAQRPADGFPHLFMEAFATAYEGKLRALTPPRRGTFGADRHETTGPDGRIVGDP